MNVTGTPIKQYTKQFSKVHSDFGKLFCDNKTASAECVSDCFYRGSASLSLEKHQ